MEIDLEELVGNFSAVEFFGIGMIEFVSVTTMYLVLAGLAFYKLYIPLKKKVLFKRIQKKFPKEDNYWFEFKYSIMSLFIFGLTTVATVWCVHNGWTQMYYNVSDMGVPYLIFSIVVVVFIHDTYFYWGHRFMHIKGIYNHVHLIHHKSINPSPWAAFCFHPLEAIVEAAVIPLIIFSMPVHYITIIAFFLFMTSLNVIGHLGYELYPAGFTKNKWTGWNNTSTHHNMHHKFFNFNYGLYFNFWDKWMGTNHPDYHETFEKIAQETEEPSKE